jgi:hypothetical protein
MIMRIFSALLLGLLLIIMLAPYDPWVKDLAGTQFKKAFEKAMDCTIDFEVESLNLISPCLSLKNVTVTARDNDLWHWSCDSYVTGFTWAHLFTYGIIDMGVTMSDMSLHSSVVDRGVGIASHLQRLLNPKVGLPLQLKHFVLRKAMMTFVDAKDAYHFSLLCNGEAKRVAQETKLRFYLSDGDCFVGSRHLWHNMSGSLLFDIRKKKGDGNEVRAHADLSVVLNGSKGDIGCSLSGVWTGAQGRFSINTTDDSLACRPCVIHKTDHGYSLNACAQGSLSELMWLYSGEQKNIDARCSLAIAGALDGDHPCSIDVVVKDCVYNEVPLIQLAKVQGVLSQRCIQGTLSCAFAHNGSVSALWKYDLAKASASLTFDNVTELCVPMVPRISIKPHHLLCIITTADTKKYVCVYDALISHGAADQPAHLAGMMTAESSYVTVQGKKDEFDTYVLELTPCTYPYLLKATYESKGMPLFVAERVDDNRVSLRAHLSLIKTLFPHAELQAEGSVLADCVFDKKTLSAKVHLDKGAIRLAQTYNFIDALSGNLRYCWNTNTVCIDAIDGSLHYGSWSIRDGVIMLDRSYQPSFIHIPLLFNRCLLTIKRDVFIAASGRLLVEHQRSTVPHVSGSVIIDRGQIKENIFSPEFQRRIGIVPNNGFRITNPGYTAAIDIQSRNPIVVDTPFLKTNLKTSLSIARTLEGDTLEGAITLSGGLLRFPYKPLEIVQGSLYFDPATMYDPAVELVARNVIRNHRIQLQVTGSLLNHHIVLESNPPLTDEQIVGLLLVGSAEESLKNMIPALILNNLPGLIFGSNQFAFMKKYFNPLGNAVSINLIPIFTDQTGRGGLRGALEITVNDRWRALIQKNFSLTEDTRFELEYLVADDIAVRALRDERKNIALETEMRWKF